MPVATATAEPLAVDTETAAPVGKPMADATVRIDPSSITSLDADVRIEVEPTGDVDAARVSLEATGATTVDGTDVAVATDAPDSVTVAADIGAGRSTITATLTTESADGTTSTGTSTLWVQPVAGEVVVSATSAQDLDVKVVDVREEKGLLGGAEADQARAQILSRTDATTYTAQALASCAELCFTGTVLWTDSVGGTHVVRKAPVQVWEDVPAPGADQLLGQAVTDATGAYVVLAATATWTGNPVFTRVLAAGPGFHIATDTGVQQVIESTPIAPTPGVELVTDFTTNNVDPNNTAFSLQNAMVVAGEYVLGVRGALFPEIEVAFPNTAPTGGSYYTAALGTLFVDPLDRFDWDVMLHEYGHYVADQLDIEDNPGGSHSSADNLSVTRGSKAVGIPLAFGEGWPTYFAVSLLREMGTAALNIPNVGDTKYQDTEDQDITEDLEIGGTLGEDNVFTVMSILWDLADTEADGLDTVALGTAAVWTRMDAADPTTLTAAYNVFSAGGSPAENGVNCIFSQYNVAPLPAGSLANDVGPTAASPTITWSPGNGGSYPNNSFVVEYRNATDATLLHSSGAIATTSYTAPAAQWQAAVAASGGEVHVTVIGTQTAAPVTGPYRSCRQTFDVGPVLAALDDTISVTAGGAGPSVLANDTVNSAAATATTASVTPGASPAAGLTMDAAGVVSAAPSTTPGTYAFPYSLCSVSEPTICVAATATVTVIAQATTTTSTTTPSTVAPTTPTTVAPTTTRAGVLPVTGGDSGSSTLVAGLVLGAGLALLLVARRRRVSP